MTKLDVTSAQTDEGFQWITNESLDTYVTIDSYQRLYISASARTMLGVSYKRHFYLIAGYDKVNHRIVLAKPEIVRVPNVKPYKFDKRAYSRVKNFVREANIKHLLPARYIFIGRDYSEYGVGAYAFELRGYDAPDKGPVK